MEWNSHPTGEGTDAPLKLKEARHKGWLAGVALRLGTGLPGRCPYRKGTGEYNEYQAGFEEGFAG